MSKGHQENNKIKVKYWKGSLQDEGQRSKVGKLVQEKGEQRNTKTTPIV